MNLNQMISASERYGWSLEYCEIEHEYYEAEPTYTFIPIWTNARGVVRKTYHTFEEALAYTEGLLAMEAKEDEEAYIDHRNSTPVY